MDTLLFRHEPLRSLSSTTLRQICSVLDMLPDGLTFEVSATTNSGLSQQLEDNGLVNDPEIPDNEQGDF